MSDFFASFSSDCRRGAMSVRVGLPIMLTLLLAVGLWWTFHSWKLDPQTLYDAATTAIDNSDFRSARDIIGKLEKLPNEKSRVRILRGKLNLRIGLPEQAIGELELVVSDEAFRVPALTMLGEACNTLGQHLDAERMLQEALAIDPSQTEARRWLAATYYDIGAMDLAMEQLAIVSQQARNDPRPHRLRGLIQKDFKQYKGAIEDYTEAIRRVPTDADRQQILLELAECQVEQHLYADAEKSLSEVKETADSLVLKARCAQAADQMDTVFPLLERALLRDPGNLDALLFQAETLLDRNDLVPAASVLEQAVAAWPKEYQPRYQLANVWRRQGKQTEADAQSAEMLRLQKLNEEFTALHEQAFADTRNAAIRFRLGELAVELDKRQLAVTWFRASLGINPDQPAVQDALRRLTAEGRSKTP